MPAMKMPPMPMKRTYSKNRSSAPSWAIGAEPPGTTPGTAAPSQATSGTSTK